MLVAKILLDVTEIYFRQVLIFLQKAFTPQVHLDIRCDEHLTTARWHVPRLGDLPTARPPSVFRFLGGQLNGMCTRSVRDRKLSQIHQLIDNWEIQGCCFQEVGINWSALPSQERMDSWFRHRHADFFLITAHNTHENFGPRQQGGVAIMMGEELRSYAKEREPDFRGLGRWCSWRIYATPTHVTRIISTYNTGKNRSNLLGTIYQQHV